MRHCNSGLVQGRATRYMGGMKGRRGSSSSPYRATEEQPYRSVTILSGLVIPGIPASFNPARFDDDTVGWLGYCFALGEPISVEFGRLYLEISSGNERRMVPYDLLLTELPKTRAFPLIIGH